MIILRMFVWMFLVTGVMYPLLVTGIAHLTMPKKARGNLISYQGRLIGSSLIAQKFTEDKYFWPRPSAVDYQPLPSGGSNLGPTSALLKKEIERRRAAYFNREVPSDLLFASGSGLDPHLTFVAVSFQATRVAEARHMEIQRIRELIDSLMSKRFLGILGDKYINILELNLALDLLENHHESR